MPERVPSESLLNSDTLRHRTNIPAQDRLPPVRSPTRVNLPADRFAANDRQFLVLAIGIFYVNHVVLDSNLNALAICPARVKVGRSQVVACIGSSPRFNDDLILLHVVLEWCIGRF